MKAVVCPKYGAPEVLQICDIDKPSPGKNDVLIKVVATSVHIGDTKLRAFRPGLGPVEDFFFKPIMRCLIGFRGPRKKVLGMEFAGEVVQVGSDVTEYKVGDKVFGATGMQFGAYAEYIKLKEDSIITHLPSNLSFEAAAPIPNGAITALIILRKAAIKKGQRVLIYGASGSVGTFAIQIAKSLGAHVTAVCSTGNIAMVRSLGADQVIDYTAEEFDQCGERFDVVFDAVGKASKKQCQKVLTSAGVYLNVLTSSGGLKLDIEDLYTVREMIERGELKAVIDRTYKLEEIVEAHRYVEQGHKKGNVVVKVA